VAALVKITELDDRLTTLTTDAAVLLLFGKKDLGAKLEKALEMDSYEEIGRLRTCHPHYSAMFQISEHSQLAYLRTLSISLSQSSSR
jgi:hypothetical protein